MTPEEDIQVERGGSWEEDVIDQRGAGHTEITARLMRETEQKKYEQRVSLKKPCKICAQMTELLVCVWIFLAVISYGSE